MLNRKYTSVRVDHKLDMSTVSTVEGPITLTSPTGAGLGYGAGAGGAVTQATNRATGVTLNKLSGTITGNAASLAGVTIATFTVTNTTVAVTDVVIVAKVSGDADSMCWVSAVAAGSFDISVRNNHASVADTTAMVINFAVIKAAKT